tara:strand:+ start:61 stop:573 length:513 start_codon:yes stop_codon:yes gene_type:complete
MSTWNEKKVKILKENWGTLTASALAEKIGGISRNAVIGKAHRLNLSAKIKQKTSSNNYNIQKSNSGSSVNHKRTRKSKFQSLIIEKDFPPESPKDLESLDDTVCRWPIGHPDEKNFYFCGRKTIKFNNRDFPYCKLHLLFAYQSKDKKEEIEVNKEDDVPIFLEKKIKSA